MRRLYLYLASRSKDGIKLITVLQGQSQVTTRLEDLKALKLPELWERQIAKAVDDNRMLYEPWVESATDFAELRRRLIDRGFRNVPQGATPLLNLAAYERAPMADTSSCKVRQTMIRKKG